MSKSQSTVYPTQPLLVHASPEDPVRVSVGQDTLRYGTALDQLNGTVNPGQSTVLTTSNYIQTDANGAVLLKRFEPWAVLEESDIDETVEGGVTFTGDVDFTNATVTGLSDSGLATHEADTTDIHGITDTSALATSTDVTDAVSTHASDTTSVHGITDTSALATTTDVSTAVTNHNNDSTNVHGITDTSVLETTTGAQTKVDNHNAATTSVHGITDTADLATSSEVTTAVSDHNSDTTSVHGIADTSVLATDSEVSTAVSDHNSDTTSVHGIADTSNLVVTSDSRFTTVTANAQTANYTLVLSDAGKAIDVTNASARTVTVPPNSSVAFATGTVVEVSRLGAGTVQILPGSGVTLNSVDGDDFIANQYSTVALRKTATDTWLLTGDLSAS